jgi:hypothetical protein
MTFIGKTKRRYSITSTTDFDALTMQWAVRLKAPLKFNPSLSHEGEAFHNRIEVGPKFFKLPDDECREAVLYHEYAHFKKLDDEALWDNKMWDLVDSGGFGPRAKDGGHIDGINGQSTPGENVVEAYSVLLMDPTWLKSKHPQVYDYIHQLASKHGLPLKRWM